MTAHQTRPTTRTAGETGAGDEWGDEDAPCPYCSNYVPIDRLCEHDDHELGPLCLDRCCERAHPVGLKLWEVPTADLKGLAG